MNLVCECRFLSTIPAGWILPKLLDPNLKERIILNLQWIVDLGHYKVLEWEKNLLETGVKKVDWPKNRTVIKTHIFDPIIMKLGEKKSYE